MNAADILASSPPAFCARDAVEIAESRYGLTVSAKLLVSERDQNFKLQSIDGALFLLKIANSAEDVEVIDFENKALSHLERVAPSLPVPRVIKAINGEGAVTISHDGTTHWVRVISWLPGRSLSEIGSSDAMRRQLGASLAHLGKGLRGFFHPAGGKQLLWDIRRTAELRDKLEFVEDESTRANCDAFIQRFESIVAPRLQNLRSQVIHNDLNASNVLVGDEPGCAVTGIIDFGDMIHAPLICDVAVGAAYQLTSGRDPLAGALQFVEAYHRVSPLERNELEVLFDLICARLVTTLIVTSWRASRYPANRDYILRNAHVADKQLKSLQKLGVEQGTSRLSSICMPVIPQANQLAAADPETLIDRRKNLLGFAYRLFYERPFHAVRGEGVWLYEPDGRACLDAYNNVPLVGHCHPEVVRALSNQAATLNTHTRYLHHTVLDYAEQLLEMFPVDLNRVMFGCSGSEANELALRLARTYTGNEGVIVSEFAYHGNTTAIAQLSPSYQSPEPPADWVETVAPPDAYRCQLGADDESVTNSFLANLDAAIDRLATRGVRPAALLLDAGFTSDGMFVAPPGCLAAAAARIREAGGVYIADEVQAGFARFGEAIWGFEMHDVTPEIVTLGKPIGNGHPLSATIVRNDILDAFSSQGRYFNTFGGNTVSAAVGLAVLNVFKHDALSRNSRDVGAYLHERLQELKSEFKIVGDVRGSGLFAGVELVLDRDSKEHATGRATQVVNDMRERGVLISMIGPQCNVLKIRPPLPFQRTHVDQLIVALQETL